jgi:cell division control protein 6
VTVTERTDDAPLLATKRPIEACDEDPAAKRSRADEFGASVPTFASDTESDLLYTPPRPQPSTDCASASSSRCSTSVPSSPAKASLLESFTEVSGSVSREVPDAIFVDWLELSDALSLSMVPRDLLGRDRERASLHTYLESAISEQRGDALFVCGSPGTGKSVSLASARVFVVETARDLQLRTPRMIELNGMCFSENPQRIFHGLLEQLSTELSAAQVQRLSSSQAQDAVEAILFSASANRAMHVVVIDELDGLLALGSAHQKILYKLFEWPRMANSSMILVGIANSMELTEKFLPFLKAHRCEPQLLVYAPYTAAQIEQILSQRFQIAYNRAHRLNDDVESGLARYIDASALTLCAKKVAIASGDLRKGFELCRKALELRQEELCEKRVLRSLGLCKPGFPDRLALSSLGDTSDTQCLLRFVDLQRAIKALMASPNVERIQGLTDCQKTLLCVADVMFCGKTGKITLGQFEKCYQYVANRDTLFIPLAATDLFDSLDALNGTGLLSLSSVANMKGAKRGFATVATADAQRARTLTFTTLHDDIDYALADVPYFARLLESHLTVNERTRFGL